MKTRGMPASGQTSFWQSQGPVTSSGTFVGTGGNATGTTSAGSAGASIEMLGRTVSNTKAITVSGGNSTGVAGANGGFIQLAGTASATVSTGTLNCEDPLPDSGKTVFERFGISRGPKGAGNVVFLTGNGQKPARVDTQHLEVRLYLSFR